ncbi:MAG TPA: protein translocase subunit SecD [Alcanivorax sp.]|jgi:preprotein translocase subunit SecD|uniref:Protein translocase subunit SecD n=1 Tax=Alloalcanivorax venustensis ISO4 TaxID=1177184 RepID=A0ABS0ACN9_9GAMM|nr:protein translocase subunit SecD [Alloalcanivorax venustensis]MAK22282.1 protein translocase subunit SecD [Alcanivorax sp.]MEC8880156.1 protein translocase subunit SecD [Pseudomonadota bacterium]MAQ33180.1 protein translocase subunit SecD [Alcanivorax sp.]MBF47233.1 protein translocase subunit SecD [Alcanivorax sp.]MBF5051885.1 preprotein translocase subunit SecD [Alloalcanivorax venustensis ISO4]|tara:strand:- start:2787 stop:4667 length:1881 start_codon:yes stop_codon:yes gene_type:complete
MTRYPRWKFFLLLAVLLGCGLYALPNLYPDVPAIQISANDAGGQVPVPVRDRVLGALDDAGIEHGEGETINNSWMVRLESTDAQLRARERISSLLGEEYVVALNLAPTTPDWLRAVGASPMNLGLDLRGGVHFLLQVDMATVIEQRMDAWSGQAKLTLRNEGIRYRSVDIEGQKLVITLDDQIAADAARAPLRTALPEFTLDQSEERPRLTLTLNQSTLDELQDYAVDQNRTALNNRVNELGVGNAVVQRQGADRIVVQLPGVQDASQARRILGRTATLEFRLVADQYSSSRASTGIAPPGTEIFPFKSQNDRPVILEKSKIATGDQVTNAQMGFDQQSGTPQVNVELDSTGARSMQRVTSKNVGNPMSVLFIETKTVMKTVEDEDGERRQVPESTTDQYVINVATIQDTLGSRFRITGLDSPAEASELALLLRAGSLAAPVTIVEERTIGPSLGQENIEAGLKSMALGMALVLLFMVIWYKVFGLFANVALLGNLVIIVGVMSLIPGATLTLPGIAGIVLTVGMAVDANVLIYERIREELRNGRRPREAIEEGYGRAFTTILDANITTMIVAVILFSAGTGSVQGFAVTLFIGILSSMFTAIIGTRALVEMTYGRGARAPAKLSI